MSISGLRAEIKEIKKSIISQYEPICKVFVLGAENSPAEAEIEAYSLAHPNTHILKVIRQSCRTKSK